MPMANSKPRQTQTTVLGDKKEVVISRSLTVLNTKEGGYTHRNVDFQKNENDVPIKK